MRELSMMEHLGELRRRVTICVAAIILASAGSFYFFDEMIDLLLRPAELVYGKPVELIYTEVTELLSTAVKISFVSGFILAIPIILYQAIMFVAPGLTGRERRVLFASLPAALIVFVAGVAFGYFVLTPPALNFLLTFGNDVATPLIKVSNIVGLMIRLLFWMGIAFETPLILYLLAQLGLVTARGLGRFRRYWVVVAFLLAALITPTVDPVNQAFVAVPLLALYEIGVLLARFAGWNRQKAEAAIMRQ